MLAPKRQRFCKQPKAGVASVWRLGMYLDTYLATYTTVDDQIGLVPTSGHHHVVWLSALEKVLQKSCQPTRAGKRI